MLVFKNDFHLFSYYAHRSLVIHEWVHTRGMNDEIFMQELRNYATVMQQHKPFYVLSDTTNFNFVLSEAVQERSRKDDIVNKGVLSIKKLAIVTTHDIFVQLSVQQALASNTEMPSATRHFDNRDEAMHWLGC